MIHIQESRLEEGDVLKCTMCQDQLSIKQGDWPFWLHLAIRDAFGNLHKDCEYQEAGKHTSYETLSYDRDDPYSRLT